MVWSIITWAITADDLRIDLPTPGVSSGSPVRSHTFHFEAQVLSMIGIYYLLTYEARGGMPGHDMRDAQYH